MCLGGGHLPWCQNFLFFSILHFFSSNRVYYCTTAVSWFFKFLKHFLKIHRNTARCMQCSCKILNLLFSKACFSHNGTIFIQNHCTDFTHFLFWKNNVFDSAYISKKHNFRWLNIFKNRKTILKDAKSIKFLLKSSPFCQIIKF